jgi:hypothetical protein
LNSTQDPLLKNISTRSVILAPFNSTKTHISKENFDPEEDYFYKGDVMKFDARVREIDRQYERNNNCELDNGVYNKFNKEEEEANKEKEKEAERDKEGGEKKPNIDLQPQDKKGSSHQKLPHFPEA